MKRNRAGRSAIPAARWLVTLTALCAAVSIAAETFRLTEWPAAAPKPGFHLLDGEHRPRSLADYRGRVSIVVFGFTHCPDVCPGELFKLALVLQRLGPIASRVQVLFISLDPERDTPELLKAYVESFDSRFIALTGPTVAVNAAAADFATRFAKVPQGGDYTISHSTGMYVIDAEGRLRLVGMPQTPVEDWLHDLSLLAGG